MKKSISLLLIVAICLSLSTTFTSCSSKHPIDDFKKRMEKANNYEMSITMSDFPLLGTITMTTKVDGNIQYIPATMFSQEAFIETVGDVKYSYTKNSQGSWVKTMQSNTTDDSFNFYYDESISEIFNSESYEKVKGEKGREPKREYSVKSITLGFSAFFIEAIIYKSALARLLRSCFPAPPSLPYDP